MSTYKINGKNFPWPEEGERNWGKKVTAFVFALAHTVNQLLARAVLTDKDQLIRGEKTFTSAPRVRIIPNDGSPAHNEHVLTSRTPQNVTRTLTELHTQLASVHRLLGTDVDIPLLTPAQLQLISSTAPAHESDSPSATQASELLSLKQYLSTLIAFSDRLVPIGSIQAFYKQLTSEILAQWEPCPASAAGATFINQETIDGSSADNTGHAIFTQRTQGFFRLRGGNWMLCDGNFPLPLTFGHNGQSSLGTFSYNRLKLIPDLTSDVFLKGSPTSASSISGTNTLILNTEQLPAHRHEVNLTGQTTATGTHRHNFQYYDTNTGQRQTLYYSSGSNSISYIRSATRTQVNTESTQNGEHSHSYTCAGHSEASGAGSEIDKTPRHLAVRYYMRIV